MTRRKGGGRKEYPLHWVAERLSGLPGYLERPMFGCLACYLRGRLVLVLADGEEPWRGALFPAEREHHASLLAEFPSLVEHPVLGKWLYLSEAAEGFEETVSALVEKIIGDDPRLGVVPKPKRRGGAKKGRRRGKPPAEEAIL